MIILGRQVEFPLIHLPGDKFQLIHRPACWVGGRINDPLDKRTGRIHYLNLGRSIVHGRSILHCTSVQYHFIYESYLLGTTIALYTFLLLYLSLNTYLIQSRYHYPCQESHGWMDTSQH